MATDMSSHWLAPPVPLDRGVGDRGTRVLPKSDYGPRVINGPGPPLLHTVRDAPRVL